MPTGGGFVLVLDLEDSGNADVRETGASLLEVGGILCRDDTDLTPIDAISLLVCPVHPGETWSTMVPVVCEMHTKSGLWVEAVRDGAPVEDIDQRLAAWLDHRTGGCTDVVLAGSGVSHHDQPWLRAHLPATNTRLRFGTLDAAVIRRGLQFARRNDLVDLERDLHAKPHRALADAELHRAELVGYLRMLSRIPAA
ncbi:hypothetical protein [Kineococcus rhizosphaerae]|uniref:hypothetical protein n=1 Tax=Kineococcus rhizosphaerae TaxID=559628 RepID=UPI0011B23D56|nr:hypothetical protein [Kineococcus rhizosphaerae]